MRRRRFPDAEIAAARGYSIGIDYFNFTLRTLEEKQLLN